MNVVFMGTPEFAVPSLRMLLETGYRVAAVVTQPDRPKGRKRIWTPPPVKTVALEHDIPVLQPERLRRPEAVQAVADFRPDLIVTAAYGQILPKSILDLPKYGCINVHASLLPKYRGGAPIHHAVMNGDAVTGVTIMYMAEGLDTGDMISKVELPILPEDTTGTLFHKLSVAGAELLGKTVPDLVAGRLQAVPQKEDEATYAPNITREDERIDWHRSAADIFNQIRGLNPFPGAYTTWNGEVLKIWASRCLQRADNETPSAKPETAGKDSRATKRSADEPGTVVRLADDGIAVQTGRGTICLTQVQPAGKKAMDAAQFVRGANMKVGVVLGG